MIAQPKIILGIDEVGRGPWAGPLVVGAVILGADFSQLSAYQDLADSKKLTAKRRAALAPIIHQSAAASATGWVSSAELDHYGLSASLKLATRRAVKSILATKVPFSEIIIDGTVNFLQNTPLADRVTLLKKADSLIKEVSAASIIAKVARDDYMVKLAVQYPTYGFESHVGYGTAKHKSALLTHGVCPEHRQSFRPIREVLAQTSPALSQSATSNSNSITTSQSAISISSSLTPSQPAASSPISPNSTTKGQTAELAVARYLETLGHTIIAHNFKTPTYEIDLISIQNQQIFFTEVKYRAADAHGSGLDQVTPAKRQRMQFAAENFLSHQQNFIQQFVAAPQKLQPLLAVAAVSGTNYNVDTWFILE